MKTLITMKDGTEICTGDYVDFVAKVVQFGDHPTTPRGGVAYIGTKDDVVEDCRRCMSAYNQDPMGLMMTLGTMGTGVTTATSYGADVHEQLEERLGLYNARDLGPCVIILGPKAMLQINPVILAGLDERG